MASEVCTECGTTIPEGYELCELCADEKEQFSEQETDET